MKRILGSLVLVTGAALATSAAATTWTSDGASAATSPSACTTSGVTPSSNACQMTVTVGGQTIRVRAYSTRNSDQTSTGLWRSAAIAEYAGGFGVTNVVGGDTGEGSQPEHATDNNQTYDVLVFEMPTANFDVEAFRLGWAQEATTYGHADIQTWFGGNNLASNFNFSNACFSSCTNTTSGGLPVAGSLSFLGFTDISSSMSTGTNGSDTPVDTDIFFNGTQSGRYLVMSGALGGTNDHFKVEMIKGVGGGPGGGAPLPGTAALFGLGFVGLAAMRRRAKRA